MPEPRSTAQRPVLVAHLTETARDFLAGAALANRAVYVPLVSPPAGSSVHVLEVHAPDGGPPLTVLAQPIGPPTAKGYPLTLSMHPGEGEPVPELPPASRKATVAYAGAPPSAVAPPPARAQKVDPHATLQAPPEDDAAAPVLVPEGGDDKLVGRGLSGGKLLIEACVGQGGAGSVYRARHRDLHMSVAVKVMHESYQKDADFCRRFHTEALSASRLDHPNLTRVLDFGQEPDGLLYIAMEYLDGQSLRDALDAKGKLPLERVANIMIQVCAGLTHAHARSIVHRDIKPENLMVVRGLDEDGKESEIVKVCDFGIAHRGATDGKAIFAGTVEYMAPELFRGDEPDVQSDVYACGVVLYELLTGLMPIPGDFHQVAARVQIVEPEPPSRHVSGLDARIDRIVMKALAKQKQQRHASVKQLRDELKAALDDLTLFSSGGYWGDIEAAPVSARPAAPAAPEAGDGPDWLERGPGYLQSMVPASAHPSPAPSPPSQRAPLSASLMPSMRAPSPSISSIQPPSSRQGPPSSVRIPVASAHGSVGGMPAVRPPAPSHGSIAGTPAVRPPAHSYTSEPAIMTGSSAMDIPQQQDATDDARQVAAFLRQLMQTTDPVKFAGAVPQLDPKIRALMAEAQAGVLWRLTSTLDVIAGEGSPRSEHAKQLLRVLIDPQLLAPVAEKALDGLADKEGTARKMIVRAGKHGSYALYSARLKHASFEARERFVAILQEMGAPSLAMLRAGLERLESRLAHTGATPLAEDILKALPAAPDEATGNLVARYARSDSATLAHLATMALPKIAGVRARSLLVGLVDHKDDQVAIAAIKGLRELDQIDAAVIRSLEPLILGELTSRMPPRVAAVEALARPTADAIGPARTLLTRALQQTTGTTPDAEDLVVVAATSLIAIGGDATLVAERWRKSTMWLRTRLEAVLRQVPKAGL